MEFDSDPDFQEAYQNAFDQLKALDPNNPQLTGIEAPDWVPSWDNVNRLNVEIDRLTTPSAGLIAAFQRQLDQNGVESITKSQISIQQRLDEHIDTLPELEYTSSVNREIRTYSAQLRAIQTVLGR